MSEMSDYFESCPQDNPANWTEDGHYDPAAAAAARAKKAKAARESADLQDEINRIIEKHRKPAAGGDNSNKP